MREFADLASLDHRGSASRLLTSGWTACGIGEWATVYRSPDGLLACRISPFEPGYGLFTELCRELEGHPALPRVEFDRELRGGGRATVMEFLYPAEASVAEAARRDWESGADRFARVRAVAERLDSRARVSVPFWGGLDLRPANIMTSRSGEVRLVDLFYVSGHELYAALLSDPVAFASVVAPERCEYAHEIALVAQRSTPEEIEALRRALAAMRTAGA